ncbi:serine/threonine protein kinase [Streptomyces sp. NBC_01142]|uniref:serine/threonine-protein kinase n=1 Tax=Streptomyces sp. NBC_01142 TaxID=2975865 RepID=UPI00224DC2D0|nr:serine/threonine-protein kinase [Streptomyces sp. NBC_01142]MCX4822038.1 serine/threonine protein kinase [Streptomyces sp. NBC_01142]
MSEVPGIERLIAGRYRLLSPLGEGGMGVVWRAHDEVLGREVAVKEVRAPAALGNSDEQRLYARLEREAWAAARISHRNVVTVYDVATEDGRPWIVMELVRGLTFSDVLDAEGPLTPQRAAHIGAEVLAALRAAHEAGVLHRDVKPGNVLIGNDGRVVLTDFGIATVEGTSHLTMTGELIGSPEFLSPERALGRSPGPESDLWALGVLLYAAVEGNTPFRQNTPLSTLRAVVDEELPPPRRAGALEPVIEGLLRKDPADRLSAQEAERRLRVVGAGGTARTASPQPAPGAYSPTVAASSATPAAGSFGPPSSSGAATTGSSGTATTGVVQQNRSRRATVVVAAGVATLLLGVGGLSWALVNNGKDRGGSDTGGSAVPAGGSSRSSAPPGATTPGTGTDGGSSTGGAGTDGGTTNGSSGNNGTDGGSGDSGAHGGTDTPPTQTVQVYAQTVQGSYSGTCPPPEAEAPAFRATITVGRTPAAVEYRWATLSGESSDPGWKSLRFAAGDGRQKQVSHIELTYKQGERHHDRIRVEVRSPVEVRSGWIDFSVTCEQETPSDEGSYTADTAGSDGTGSDGAGSQ